MLESGWEESSFDLLYTLSELRLLNNRYLVDMWVSADDRDSSVNIAQVGAQTVQTEAVYRREIMCACVCTIVYVDMYVDTKVFT